MGGQIIYSNLDSPWRLFKMTNCSEISHWAWCNISEMFAERANFNFQLGILRDLIPCYDPWIPLQWYHNARGSVSNHQRLHRLLNCWFRRTSKKTPKLRVTGLCAGNSPVTGEFPAQKASNAECFHLMTSSCLYDGAILLRGLPIIEPEPEPVTRPTVPGTNHCYRSLCTTNPGHFVPSIYLQCT